MYQDIVKSSEKNLKDSRIFNEWHKTKREKRSAENRYLLVGTPNVGKSTFFNRTTNAMAPVSNIDRMTVCDTIGRMKSNKTKYLVDLPGLYNLSHPIDEELVVAHEIVNENFEKITNIIGSQSIERDLLLSLQAIETGLVNSLIINMIDEVDHKQIDIKKLSRKLGGVLITKTQTNKRVGLKTAERNILNDITAKSNIVKYSDDIESLIKQISALLPKRRIDNRFYAIMMLEQNKYILDFYKRHFNEEYLKVEKILSKSNSEELPAEILIQKKTFVRKLIGDCIKDKKAYFNKCSIKQKKIDRLLLQKWIGIPSFALLVVAIYYITFGPYMGGTLHDLFADNFLNDIVADQWLKTLFVDIFKANEWVTGLFVDGIFKGFFAVMSFIIPITILFICVNLIQQVGLLARVSILLDNALDKFGISGRGVISLLTGFGCNVPAIMMARSSNSKKERVVSVLIAPFIACSARIIVFSFVCQAMFGSQYGWIGTFLLIVASGTIALTLGLVFSKILFRKQKSFFMVEVVDWRRPDVLVISKGVWLQLREFLKKSGTVIVLASFIIWLFLHLGPAGLLSDNELEISFIGYISKWVNSLLFPLGFFMDDGWKLTASLLTAIPAKEIAISNLTILFGSTGLESYFATHVAQGLSYLISLMLYIPCAATIYVMKKEGSWKLVGYHLIASLSLSYVLSTLIFWMAYATVLLAPMSFR